LQLSTPVRKPARLLHAALQWTESGFRLHKPYGKPLADCSVNYVELTKPRITCFILMSTAIGFLCGARVGNAWTWVTLLHTLIGTALIASGTAALNQWYERLADAKMDRTKGRPIPSGRVTAAHAAWFGVLLSVVGFAELWLGANLLTGMLGLFTLASYLFVYTPLKQRSPHSTTIGAIPGAMPPLIGYAAASGTLTWEAGILYAILFLWQFPHFYAIAWMYREDYARAGIRMLPVVEPDGESTTRRIMLFSLILIPISLLPKFTAMAGNFYLYGALALGLLYLYAGVRAAFDRSFLRARQVLLASVVYLPLLYGLLVFDRPSL
jgi:protoheme IX farnesyltransferase